jgi:hypothetical protein
MHQVQRILLLLLLLLRLSWLCLPWLLCWLLLVVLITVVLPWVVLMLWTRQLLLWLLTPWAFFNRAPRANHEAGNVLLGPLGWRNPKRLLVQVCM